MGPVSRMGPLTRHSRSCRLSARKPADSVSQSRLEIKVSRPLRILGIRETPHAVLRLRVLPKEAQPTTSLINLRIVRLGSLDSFVGRDGSPPSSPRLVKEPVAARQ